MTKKIYETSCFKKEKAINKKMNIIECIEVSKCYRSFFSKPVLALDKFSANIRQGKITALLGANGAGKSTLMRLISSLEYPSSGKILVNGFSVLDNSLEIKKIIGYMSEVSDFYPDLKVLSFLMLGKKLRNLSNENLDWAIAVSALEEVLDKKIGSLSKGFRQRLSLAQAIIHKPQILILDEPSSGLDPAQSHSFKTTIKNLNKEEKLKTTTLFSSHSTSEIEAIADDILVIDNGKLIFSGTIDALLKKTNEDNLENAYMNIRNNNKENLKDEVLV